MTPTLPIPIGNIWSAEEAARFIKDTDRYAQQVSFYHSVDAFLKFLANWQANSETRVAYGLLPDPPPVPPAGYTVPAPPPPPVKPVPANAVVGEGVQDRDYGTIYPAPGDTNSAGTKIDNPHKPGNEMIVKVVKATPFGPAHFWIDAA